MTNIPFYQAGDIGIIKDIHAHEIPPQAWSDGTNIQFRNGKAVRRMGQQKVYTPGQLGQAFWLALAYTTTNVYWIYADQTHLYATDGAVHADVTRVSGVYSSMDIDRLWSGGMFGGVPVYTNGKDVPQAWVNLGLSQRFVDLANWTVGDLVKIIKPYKNFLVGMAVSRGGNTLPNTVKWSAPAAPGNIPSSWDAANPATQAGEVDLADEYPGGIRDALPLRDNLIIYKDNAVWGMQFIGGNAIFRFFQILGGIGILGPNCVCQVNQGVQHLFASNNDLVLFDGQSTKSVLDRKWKKFLSTDIDPAVAGRSFMFALERENEAWFCYPQVGNKFPNVALVWNWRDDTIAHRTLGELISFAAIGPVVISGDPWDLDTATWDSDATIWDLIQFRANYFDILAAVPAETLGGSKLLELNITQQFDGVDYNAFVERQDIALIGQDRVTGAFKADFENRKLANRIWPHVEGSPLYVTIGSQEVLGGVITWEPSQLFTPGVDNYLDFTVNGMFIAVRFESFTAGEWKLDGYNMEIQPLGNL